MATALMAHPELRLPFEEFPIQPEDSATVLYQGRKNTLSETGDGDGLLIRPEDLTRVNGFELEPEGACLGDRCIPLKNDLLVGWGGRPWFGLAAFTNLLEQPHSSYRKALIVTWSSWWGCYLDVSVWQRVYEEIDEGAYAACQLGNLFRARGQKTKAERYWEMARSLNPESINFLRQNLTLTEEGSAGVTFRALRDEYIRAGKD